MKFKLSLSLLVLALSFTSSKGSAQQMTEVRNFGDNPGDLKMFVQTPSTSTQTDGKLPVIVNIHGCDQYAEKYAFDSGWSKVATSYDAVLVAPEQSIFNNGFRCFNWFSASDITPGSGEIQSIKEMIDYALTNLEGDPKKIYVSGISAGAAMAGALLASYPELFQAGSLIAGTPVGCASNFSEGYQCMQGVEETAETWGEKVRAKSNHTGEWPRIAIWYGESDAVSEPTNADELIKQWTNVHQISKTPWKTHDEEDHKVSDYGPNNVTKVKLYWLKDFPHGHPITIAEDGKSTCGRTAKYIIKGSLCASKETAKFFFGQ